MNAASAESESIESLICQAIQDRRLVAFRLDGCDRIAEPHDYGLTGGQRNLFFYQVGGASRSGRPLGWRWAALPKIQGLRLLAEGFDGPRAIPTGRHHQWDRLIASVSLPVG
jgi:hypothetical protein